MPPANTPTERLPPFSRRLAALRTAQGLSAAEVARRCVRSGTDMTDQTILNIERGARPYADTAAALAAALGADLLEMLAPEPIPDVEKARTGP